MRLALFCHSLVSDWNHGNAHFLRGVVSELLSRGHEVVVYEPEDAWSRRNLLDAYGESAIAGFEQAFPELRSHRYRLEELDLDRALEGVDLALVHEWNAHSLVKRIGAARARMPGLKLLFHDTHHRAVSDPEAMSDYDLRHYDGVLAFGRVVREIYLRRGWAERAFVWHEAADTRMFRPRSEADPEADLVWIGNFGDGERTRELTEYLVEPVRSLRLRACAYGVRYPDEARAAFERAGIDYGGWVPNHEVPRVYGRFKLTVHVPRRPYVEVLPGVPTIRVFEALASGIPLVSTPWDDVEGLFTPGKDFLVARSGAEMQRCMKALVWDRDFAGELVRNGLATIRARHTCAHRVDELLQIHAELGSS